MKEAIRNQKTERGFLTVLAFVFATVYNYMGGDMIPIGGFDFYIYLPVSVVTVALGVIVFLIAPRFARMEIVCRQLGVNLLPFLFPAGWSVIIWGTQGIDMVQMRKALMTVLYFAGGICMMAALVYLAGEKTAWIYLLSLITAYLMQAAEVAIEGGVIEFIREYIRLIFTFAEDTGELMAQMELSQIPYALGSYLVWFCVEPKYLKKKWPFFILAVMCFLLGLKRIAIAAAAVAVIAGRFWHLLKKAPELERFIRKIVGVIFLSAALLYVGSVFFGLYDYLEEVGVQTSARNYIYSLYKPYYDFSPAFLGNGLGWVEAQENRWSATMTDGLVFHTHNDFLREYIELGMIGFLIWCYLRCNIQVSKAWKILGADGGIVAFALLIYMAITYMTENTATQELLGNTFAVIVMSYMLRDREEKRAKEMELENRRKSEVLAGYEI